MSPTPPCDNTDHVTCFLSMSNKYSTGVFVNVRRVAHFPHTLLWELCPDFLA